MDEIVLQAIAKWPNVPHCYGWLALDARGAWRMRDERAQALKLPGDKIAHATLLGFINRNYQADDQGRWYFQNGPQRVYVNLDATPYIAHSTPDTGFVLQTGTTLPQIDHIFFNDSGQLILLAGPVLAQVDDRDIAACLTQLYADGHSASDEQVMEWLDKKGQGGSKLTMLLDTPYCTSVELQYEELPQLAARFGFVRAPQPDAT